MRHSAGCSVYILSIAMGRKRGREGERKDGKEGREKGGEERKDRKERKGTEGNGRNGSNGRNGQSHRERDVRNRVLSVIPFLSSLRFPDLFPPHLPILNGIERTKKNGKDGRERREGGREGGAKRNGSKRKDIAK